MYLYPSLSESIIYLIVYLILLIDQTALDAGQELLGTVEMFEHCVTEKAIIGEWDFVYRLGVNFIILNISLTGPER